VARDAVMTGARPVAYRNRRPPQTTAATRDASPSEKAQVPGTSVAEALSSPVRSTEAAFSVFHEPWWLDVATDGRWSEAVVRENGAVIGRLPYPIGTRFGMPVSLLPTLIRTLGPAIGPLPGKPATVLRRRLEITNALIDQLPRFAMFEQLLDPRVTDGVAFAYRNFVVGTAYCFRIDAGQSADDTWAGMMDKTRNVIRKAEASLRVDTVDEPDEFCRFHETALRGASNVHGTARMRALISQCQERNAGTILGVRNAQGALEAAVTFVWDSSALYYFLSARHPAAALNGAVSLLIWHGMRIARERGLIFDLDGVNSPGMLQFLSGFGGRLTQRLRVRRLNSVFRLVNAAESLVSFKSMRAVRQPLQAAAV